MLYFFCVPFRNKLHSNSHVEYKKRNRHFKRNIFTNSHRSYLFFYQIVYLKINTFRFVSYDHVNVMRQTYFDWFIFFFLNKLHNFENGRFIIKHYKIKGSVAHYTKFRIYLMSTRKKIIKNSLNIILLYSSLLLQN